MKSEEIYKKTPFPRPQFHIILTILVMILIFIQSALPGDLSAEVSNGSVQPIVQLTDGDLFTIDRVVRKLAHVAEYLALGLCLMVNVLDLRKSRGGQRPQEQRRSVIADCGIAWAVGTIYAMTDEFHQTLVPGRSGEVLDVCIDAAGVLCGVVIMSSIVGRRRKGRVSSLQVRLSGNGAGVTRAKSRNERWGSDLDTLKIKNEKSVDNFRIR